MKIFINVGYPNGLYASSVAQNISKTRSGGHWSFLECAMHIKKTIAITMLVVVSGLLLILLVSSGTGLQCVDEDGAGVDWLVMYKLPKEAGKKFKEKGVISEGKGYAYITSKGSKGGWIISEKSVEDPTSIPGQILSPLYSGKAHLDLMYMFYNDEHPEGNTSLTMGHTKGVIAFNQKTGFWLVHSVPKFPPYPDSGKYGYPSTGERYGQSFLCISINTKSSADLIGNQFLYNHPFVYASNIPKWASSKYPNFVSATNEKHIKTPPFFKTAVFSSIGGASFTSFAKYTKFGKDLYADLVAPALEENLLVESWPNGPGKMNSSCKGPFYVENIDEIDFGSLIKGVDFTTQHDHSKWAISFTPNSDKKQRNLKFVCIGDINRMETQKKRGGGTVCFQHDAIWKAFSGIIKNLEPCPAKN